jgi:aldehyde:ferredoxin oxidoreductase
MFVDTKGSFAGSYGEGLELTTVDFGPKMGNADMALTAKLHALLDEYGLDYFETTNLIAFATECFEKGILTKEDTDGLELVWGNANAALGIVNKIVDKQGFGVVLAEGVKRAAEAIGNGAEKYAMQAKGQALVGRDPRTSKGWGLAYAVSNRGPCHVRAHIPETYPANAWDASVHKILAKYDNPTDPLSEEGKAELVRWYEDIQAFKNCMEICLYTIYPWMIPSGSEAEMLTRLFRAVTGTCMEESDLLIIGERINNIERAFNVREGLSRKDDTLPARVLEEPYPDGPAKGQTVNLDLMIDEYYEFRGWDKATGFPKKEKLCELQLENVADELQRMDRLSKS